MEVNWGLLKITNYKQTKNESQVERKRKTIGEKVYGRERKSSDQ
jgi:hypothetical protein